MLTVGQKLWYMPWRHTPCETTVSQVARKWATMVDHRHPRADITNGWPMWADGGQHSSPGVYYQSREAYEEDLRLTKLWQDFANGINRVSRNRAITESDIRQAADLLQIGLPK